MRFRNSIRLLMENFRNVYKVLFYKLVIAVIGIALASALLVPNLLDIIRSPQWGDLIEEIKSFVHALLTADSTILGEFPGRFEIALKELGLLLQTKMSKIIWSIIGCVVIYLCERFLDTLCYFAVGCILNDRMSIYSETSFSAAYVKNLGKASIYSIVYVPIVFVFDLLVIALCYFMFFYLLSFLGVIVSLFLSFTVIMVCQALKLSVTSMWMPSMAADNKTIGQAMKFGDKVQKKQFINMFSTYLISAYIIFIINIVSAVCTFGSSLLFTIPASYCFFICLQFVNYYIVKGKKYFITFDKIEKNKDRGNSEHFFEAISDDYDETVAVSKDVYLDNDIENNLDESEKITDSLKEEIIETEEFLNGIIDSNEDEKKE